jgi:hypothetical protein
MQCTSLGSLFVCLAFFAILNIFQFYDGGQFLLVEEKTRIHVHYTMYLGIDYRPSSSKLTNFPAQSHRYEQDSNRRCLFVRNLVV